MEVRLGTLRRSTQQLHDSLRSDVARSGTDISTATAEGQPGVDSSLTDTQSRNPSDVGPTPGNTSPRDAGPGELQLDGGAAPGYSESGSASEVSRDSGGDVTTPTTAFSSDTLVALDAGDATSARVAPECDDGSFWDANLSTCRNWTTCDAGTSVSAGGTQLSDRQCAPCATDTFSSKPNAEACSPCNTCGWLGLETACTKVKDSTCRDTDVTKKFGTSGYDIGRAVVLDGSGSVWVAGFTDDRAYHVYPLVRQYSPDGSTYTNHDVGKLGRDSADALAADASGNVWAGGHIGVEAFIAKFAPGNPEPTVGRFAASSGTGASTGVNDMSTDAQGNVWAVGYTEGDLAGPNLGGFDAFVRRVPADGGQATNFQFGTDQPDFAQGVAVTSTGVVWVVGSTSGDLADPSAGFSDAFIRRYPTDSSAPESEQFGSSAGDAAYDVVVDVHDNVWVAGVAGGDFLTGVAYAKQEAFVRKYPASGDSPITYLTGTTISNDRVAIALRGLEVWLAGKSSTSPFIWGDLASGTPSIRGFGEVTDSVNGLTFDRWGNLWVVGSTPGADTDVYVRQIVP